GTPTQSSVGATLTARMFNTPSPTFAIPTAIMSDEGAFREAYEILYASNPPYETVRVDSARYVRTDADTAYAIAQTRRPGSGAQDACEGAHLTTYLTACPTPPLLLDRTPLP